MVSKNVMIGIGTAAVAAMLGIGYIAYTRSVTNVTSQQAQTTSTTSSSVPTSTATTTQAPTSTSTAATQAPSSTGTTTSTTPSAGPRISGSIIGTPSSYTITINGSSFAPSGLDVLYLTPYQANPIQQTIIRADASGSWSYTVSGSWALPLQAQADDQLSGNTSNSLFLTISAPAVPPVPSVNPQVTESPTTWNPGGYTVSGTGFTPGGAVQYSENGPWGSPYVSNYISGITADSNGNFTMHYPSYVQGGFLQIQFKDMATGILSNLLNLPDYPSP